MKAGVQLKTTQNLALTPQLQQAIRLLQLSNLELEAEVEHMLEDNPFLEREDEEMGDEEAAALQRTQADAQIDGEALEREGAAEYESAGVSDGLAMGTETEASAEIREPEDWTGEGSMDLAPQSDEWGDDAPTANTPGSGAADPDFDSMSVQSAHESLQDHLHRQALGLRLDAEAKAALYFLIESLNDDGYLEDSLVSLAQSLAGDDFDQLEEVLAQLQIALGFLRNLEPVGVGARDLAECLKLQLLAQPASPVRELSLHICASRLDLLAKKDVKGLMQACAAPEALVRQAMQTIARLEPRPARRFAQVERLIIVPDVIVRAKGRGLQREFVVQLNPDTMPRLRVHSVYAQALKNAPAGGAQQSLNDARSFIKNIQQRFDTILRTAEAIVERQRAFFLHGPVGMKPLVLREIADILGMHESTISRVTTAKYMATPQGTFEMKYFFSSSLGTQSGGDASSTAVRAFIKQWIEAEDKHKPLSDGAIAERLAAQGIDCARRTVAKYREGMRIPTTSVRRER